MRANQMRAFSRISATGVPGPEGSIQKIFWSELNQRLQQVAQELLGPYGQLEAARSARDRSRRVVVRLPARARQHDRSRHVGNPAQHHRPFRPRPAEKLLMQFGLNENQVILRDSAREFFAGECPMAFVRRARRIGHRLRRRRSGQSWPPRATPESSSTRRRWRRPGHRRTRAADGGGGTRAPARAVVCRPWRWPAPCSTRAANRAQSSNSSRRLRAAMRARRSRLSSRRPAGIGAALQMTATNGRLSGEKLFVPDAGVADIDRRRRARRRVRRRCQSARREHHADGRHGPDAQAVRGVADATWPLEQLDASAGLDRALDIATTALAAEMVGGMQRDARHHRGLREDAQAVRQADRIVPGGAASVRGHVSRNRKRALGRILRGLGAAGRRARRRRRGVDRQAVRQRRLPRRSATAASRSTAAWASRGRTICICTTGAPRRPRRCSATRRSIASGWPRLVVDTGVRTDKTR